MELANKYANSTTSLLFFSIVKEMPFILEAKSLSANEIALEILDELRILEDYKLELANREKNFGHLSREINASDYIDYKAVEPTDEDYSDTFGRDPTTESELESTTIYAEQILSIKVREANDSEIPSTNSKIHISTLTFLAMLTAFVIMFLVMIICIYMLPTTEPIEVEMI